MSSSQRQRAYEQRQRQRKTAHYRAITIAATRMGITPTADLHHAMLWFKYYGGAKAFEDFETVVRAKWSRFF